MIFTADGSQFSWCSSMGAQIRQCGSSQETRQVGDSRVAALDFSPMGTYLSTWAPYTAKESAQDSCNMHVWDVKTTQCVKSFIQKKQNNWKIQWSDDEKICARNVSNEVQFYENANFGNIAKKIYLQKVAYFSLSPGAEPFHVACFVPGTKGQPSFVRLFKYPTFEGPTSVIAQKSFFKAERTDFYWNKTGRDCIFLTSVDVDKSGLSYYGELNLYYVSVKGDTAKIKLGKDGPVYAVEWSPNSKEFCVVYGYMPAKATIYSLKCEALMEFEAAPRNEVNYSPVGERLALSGSGNLQGQIEVWDLKTKKQVSKFKAQDSTLIQWSPDGEYVLTATTAPRLRIGNGYRIWHYTGSLLAEVFLPSNEDLYDARWVPDPGAEAKPTTFRPVAGIKSAVPDASTQAYRPPGARGAPSSFKLRDEEEPKKAPAAALTKNQKKNLARKNKKESEKGNENETVKREAPTRTNDTGLDMDKEKKIKTLLKKLDQIAKLKQEQSTGKTLELNQLEKIKKAGELEAELEELRLS